MSRAIRIIIIVISVLAIVAVGAVAVWYFYSQPSGETNTNTQANEANTNTEPVNGANTNTEPANTNENTNTTVLQEDDSATVLRLARIFTERFGSYSNRNNFENITTLEPFMTERMQTEMAEYIDANTKEGIPDEFYGITTTVVSTKLDGFTEEQSATVTVGTKRVETRGQQDPTVLTQDASVKFQYVEGNWKVDKFTWK